MAQAILEQLSLREKALLALALLLDGQEAEGVLAEDLERGAVLRQAVKYFLKMPPQLRMALVGTLLRRTLEEMRSSQN